jgi:hypothetical protein
MKNIFPTRMVAHQISKKHWPLARRLLRNIRNLVAKRCYWSQQQTELISECSEELSITLVNILINFTTPYI